MKQLAFILAAAAALCATAAEPVLVGHRGSDIGIESSREALEEGARRGYPFLESDIRVAGDGTFVLSHDETTERLGSGLVVAATSADSLLADTLRQTRWDIPYEGRMATLADMLEICKQYGCRPLIELKWATGINSEDTSGIPALIDFITEAGMRDKCMILTSMKPAANTSASTIPTLSSSCSSRPRSTRISTGASSTTWASTSITAP